MNTHTLALQLLAAQGLLGAFDTLYHHELTESLPRRQSARLELCIHAVRALLYSALFIGLSAWEFHGAWTWALIAVFVVEILLTLWDFVVEDKTRLLPATERVTHTILAINGGAFITLLALSAPAWLAMPTALVYNPHGLLSAFLALCGIGVGLSGVRDGLAAASLRKIALRDAAGNMPDFGAPRSFLITGATGFLGQKLVPALLHGGHRVTVLTREPRQAAWKFDGRVDCVDSMDNIPASRKIDVIINLAGAPVLGWRWTPARQAALRRSRIDLTRRVVAWIARADHKPELLLSASAIGFYGTQARGDDTLLDESSPPQPIFMSDLCREWEEAAQQAEDCGVKVACMRIGVVLGHSGALPMMLLPARFGFGGPMGGGTQWLSWIHADDAVGAMAHLCRIGASGPYNLTAPETQTQLQFMKVAAGVLRRPYGFPTPGWPMRLMLGEQASLLLEGQRVSSAKLSATGYRFSYPTLESALHSLEA